MKKYIYSFLLLLIVSLGYGQDKSLKAAPPGGGGGGDRPVKMYRDNDEDGYGDPAKYYMSSVPMEGYVSQGNDLDDTNPYITNRPPTQYFYQDMDGDTFGNPNASVFYTLQPPNYVTNNLDCNDNDRLMTPNTVWYYDGDHDGYGSRTITTTSCLQPTNYVSNGWDLDDATSNITNIAPQTFYRDADGDSYGNPNITVYYSIKPAGYVTNNADCNDNDATINPNTVWYRDADGDGFGNRALTILSCNQPDGYVNDGNDCNDSAKGLNPDTVWYYDGDGDGSGNDNVTVKGCAAPHNYVSRGGDCDDDNPNIDKYTIWYRDADGDGFGTNSNSISNCTQPTGYVQNFGDCNDGDSTINPNTVWYRDADGDGFGAFSEITSSCTQPQGYVINSRDCNDSLATINPNTVWYRDADGDGFGNSTLKTISCTKPTGYVLNLDDYDDSTTNITNIAPQTFYRDADGDTFGNPNISVYYSVKPAGYVTNSADYDDTTVNITNIAPQTFYRDADGDTFGNPSISVYYSINPAGYVTNNADYDDTTVNITNIAPQTFYKDADGDTFGNPSISVYYSVKPAGYVINNTDCNDADATINPNTVWYQDADADGYGNNTITKASCTQPLGYVRNSLDYDDTTVNITNIAPQTFFRDADGDGYGNPSVSVYYSVIPTGFVTNNTDCNDTDATINPNTVWYQDADADGYGNNTITNVSCTQLLGYVRNSLDYDDTTVNITNIAPQTFYRDADGDTFGNPSISVYYSVKPAGYVANNTDCNDTDATINPNTIWYRDADADGYGKSTVTVLSCVEPVGYVRNSSDYDDANANITNIAPQTFYQDADADGFGNPNVSIYRSVQPAGYVTNNTDCNDGDVALNPNTKWYIDNDMDGLGDPTNYIQQCIKPNGNYINNNLDNCPELIGSSPDCSNIKAPSSDYNYVITTTYKEPVKTILANPSPNQAQSNITYFDGLGRPIQQIANKQSNSGTDIITHIGYDDFGRQTQEYLPYAATSVNMAYEANADANTINFYSTEKYENTANPFSEKKLESSPLSRVLKQAAPGTDWAMEGGHEIKLDYQTNSASEVKSLKATTSWNTSAGIFDISFSDNGYYGANELSKTVTYDENSSSNPSETSGSTVEFKDKEGKVILKRTYETQQKHDTYYVYDNYGNLTYVIPPKADGAISDEVLNGLCYQYKYDYRNRLAEKKLPGKQWEFIVYDKLDRPVATGPANSPFKGETTIGWLITKYDAFSRPVYTGWLNSTSTSTSRKTMQDVQNTATKVFETKQTSSTIDGVAANYSNLIAPTSFKLLTVNYYDNYEYPNVSTVATSIEEQDVLSNAKGLATGSWIRAVTSAFVISGETTSTFYDIKARPIRSYSQNYLGGYTSTDSKLDFSGKPLYTITKHKRATGVAELTIKEEFTYSAQDRLLTHTHQINGGAIQLLAENIYDELGQLNAKKVGESTGNPLQKINYSYNIRGWLTGINKTDNLQQDTDPKDLFAFKINYNKVDWDAAAAQKLYNGNIAETSWITGNDITGVTRGYGYKYDQLNRLKDATYQTPSLTDNKNYFGENLDYDKNGNITRLQRKFMAGVLSNPYAGDMDNLGYYYTDNSNQLMKVSDTSNSPQGFKDDSNGYNDSSDDYAYDANGNLIKDENKNITEIRYNHLNLPTKITFGGINTIEYIYNATGQKLGKTVTDNGITTKTVYLGGFQYKDNALQFFPTAEGYVNNTPANGADNFNYVFNYTDHLGNVRVSYKKNAQNGLEILEENNYYPFGLKHQGYNSDNLQPNYKYKYNGKELQDELGLGMYDLGARMYMPDLGRFSVVDPMADFVNYQSPYVISDNNPVLNIDEYGLGILNVIGNLFKRLVGAISSIGSECNCTRTQESVGDAWRRADFPKLNEAIDDLFSKGNNGTKKKSTTKGENPKIEGISLGSIGFIVGNDSYFDTPKINIPTPVPSSVNKINNSLLATGTKIDINVKFFSNSPTINSVNSDKTLNDLLKTLIDYPQILLLIQGNVSNKNNPSWNEKSEIWIEDGRNGMGTVGELQLLRAKAIKRFLVKNGIDPKRLSVGKGVVAKGGQSASGKSL